MPIVPTLVEAIVHKVHLYHGSAEPTGISPPHVRHTYGGSAELTVTQEYPCGVATVTCSECAVVFTIHGMTQAERKAARRKRVYITGSIFLVAVFNLLGAIAVGLAKGTLNDMVMNSPWIVVSGFMSVIGAVLLAVMPFVAFDKFIVESETKHHALHIVRDSHTA